MDDPSLQTLILLPGMMCDARLFAAQTTCFKRDFGEQLCVIIPPIDRANSIQKLAQQILAEAPPCFALCGLSMGGIVAMEMVAQAPQRITGLALMDTNPLAETPAGIKRRNRQIRDVQNGKLKQVMADEMKPLYLAESPNKQQILDLCMDMALSLGDAAFICQSKALRDRPDQTQTLKSVCCPTLILHGAEDKLCPPERHQLIQDLIPHAELVAVDGAGHLPPIEMPADVTAHLCKWLALC